MLFKKLIRDLRKNISEFITVFLMVFLGIFVFSGIHAYMDGMKIDGDKYYQNNNLPDLWVTGENFTSEDLKNIKNISGVKEAERVLTVQTTLENYKDVTIEANFIESNNISQMNVMKGEKFSKTSGIWLDYYLAKNLNLKVGDTITLSYDKYKIKEKIKGLVTTPDHIYSVKDEIEIFPNHTKYGYAYLNITEFPSNYIYENLAKKIGIPETTLKENISKIIPNFSIEDYYTFNQVLVDVKDNNQVSSVKNQINKNIKSSIATTDRNSNPSYATYKSEMEEGKTYSGVFTVLFLFIALLSVVTTMNRFIKKERVQIGTLKALGFKNKKISSHYISYGFYISLLAIITGLILGPLVLGNFFLNMLKEYYEMPTINIALKPISFILAVGVIILITLATYLSCRKILKEPAVNALRQSTPNIKNKNFALTTKTFLKKASVSTKWNLRDISRNKGRSIMAIVGITGSCMLLVCAFGMLDSMNSYLDWEFNKLSKFEYKLNLNNTYTDKDLENLEAQYGNATSQTQAVEIKTNNKNKVTTLTINDAKDHLKYTDHNRNYMNLTNDGIYITEKLAKTLNVKKGDKISFHIFGSTKWYSVKITGLNRDPQNQQLNCTKKFYESLGLTYRPTNIYTNKDLKNTKNIENVESIQSISTLKKGMENMLDTTKSMISILIIVSAGLTIVIIYNLGILSFSEKQYQFATLKVIGFKTKQIKNIFIKQNIWLTIIAILLGLPLGYYLTDFIFKFSIGESNDFSAHIRPISYLYSSLGILLISIIVNKILAKKVKKIDMVSSLKTNE